MTDNKKLIEEAAKAIFAEEQCDRHQKRNAASVTENWEGRLGDADKDEYRSFARAALAVFEKAHTPTDDEREDMIAFLLRDHNFEESPWGRTYTDAEIANALRHSVVPEPQSEPSNRVIVMCARCGLFPVVGGDEINSDIVVCDRCAFAEGRESAQGEPSDATTVRLMARKGGKRQALIEQMLVQANERGVRVEVVDQVIPRYAMLDVWMALYGHETSQAFNAFYEGAEYSEAWSTLLAAIRTRAGEPQGEPSPIPFYDQKMRELAEVRVQAEQSAAQEAVVALNQALTQEGSGALRERALHNAAILARRALLSTPQVEFPFTHDGVTLEHDDGGVWVSDGGGSSYWISPRVRAALRAGGVR